MPQPLLGRLPREEGKSAVAVIPSVGAAPVRPAEVSEQGEQPTETERLP